MRNASYSKEYREYCQKQETIMFCGSSLQTEETGAWGSGCCWTKRHYSGTIGQSVFHASENELLDGTKARIYRWRNVNAYSILNLTTLQDYHYIPELRTKCSIGHRFSSAGSPDDDQGRSWMKPVT